MTTTIEMTWNDAVEILAGSKTNEHRGEAIATIANALNTKISQADLCDWIAQGEWKGTEMFEQIQAELDEVESAESEGEYDVA